jgi:MFS family permease
MAMRVQPEISSDQPGKASFPPGMANAFIFATFNALSFQIVLGSPMVLYARSLEASATVLGIIAGMMPLLVIFQVPAAAHIARVGYKKFVYAGWGTRVMFIFAMALVPLTGSFLSHTTQLALILFLLFGFNLSRGISSAAWLPWITTLVPVEIRGKYLAREAVSVHVASCVAMLFSAFCLGRQSQPWQFALLFGFSGVAGAISLSFLKKIPDAEPPERQGTSSQPVPWLEIARYEPFRKLLRMSTAWAVAYGGLGAFTVAYMNTEAAMSESAILFVTGLAFLGGLSGLAYFGSRTDRLGSKPVLTFCLCMWILILMGWLLFAGQLVHPQFGLVLFLELLMGFAYALVNMNNTRLAMILAPVMGRSHFFALYSVVANLTLGLAPMFWGLVIDAFGPRQVRWRHFELNRFSLFFGCAVGVFGLALALCRKLDEPKARELDELIAEMLRSPHKLWLRLWPRE